MVLGYENINRYVNNEGERFLGAAVGRCANRIGGGSFSIDGKMFETFKNDNGNTLHGGEFGIDRIVFDVSAKCEESGLCEAFVNLSGGDDKVSHVALRLHGVPVGVNIVVLTVVGEDSHHRQALFNEDVENSVR